MRSAVTVQYPFHPHCGTPLEVACAPRRAGAPITVVDPRGAPLKIPAWMLTPEASRFGVCERVTIDPRALLALADLIFEPVDRPPPG